MCTCTRGLRGALKRMTLYVAIICAHCETKYIYIDSLYCIRTSYSAAATSTRILRTLRQRHGGGGRSFQFSRKPRRRFQETDPKTVFQKDPFFHISIHI